MPMVCEISDCSSQGMCRGWSRHCAVYGTSCCRWCASQLPAPARQVPRLVEASARTMAQLVPMVCETGARSIDCLKWGHFFQTGNRMHHGPAGANDV